MNNIQENLQPENMQRNLEENLPTNPDQVRDSFQAAHEREEGTIEKGKEAFQENVASKLPVPTPKSGITVGQASAHEVKSRLEWGEPGLTILDIRDRDAFNQSHIQGAMNMPAETLRDIAEFSLEAKRDVYVYGNSDDEAASALDLLRQAGLERVAVIQGGMKSWQAIGGLVEGPATDNNPGPAAYNVVSRLKEFAEERARERQMK
jgi:rhodanese-related sulfurtransferase